MKRETIISFAMLTLSMSAMAQSDWQLPESKQQVEVKAKQKKTLDPKYGAGTVPTIDGKVEWEYSIKAPGRSDDALMQLAQDAIEALTKQECQGEESRITAVNKSEHIVASYLDEEMVFSSKALSRDFCRFRYTLIATTKPGEVSLRLCRISYIYDVGRKSEYTASAQEMITDEIALNKKHTKLYPTYGKFRRKTIDRKDDVFTFIESKIK